jgi:hypothetical protein
MSDIRRSGSSRDNPINVPTDESQQIGRLDRISQRLAHEASRRTLLNRAEGGGLTESQTEDLLTADKIARDAKNHYNSKDYSRISYADREFNRLKEANPIMYDAVFARLRELNSEGHAGQGTNGGSGLNKRLFLEDAMNCKEVTDEAIDIMKRNLEAGKSTLVRSELEKFYRNHPEDFKTFSYWINERYKQDESWGTAKGMVDSTHPFEWE